MASETIKEFLVELGWKIDEAGYRRFTSAISGAIEPVAKLTLTATGAITVVEAMVAATAKSMNDLYYQAQRTGVAAQSLNNLGFAAQQVGLSLKDGTGLAEAFSNSFQMNPGTAQLFKNLGGSVQELNGRLGPTDQGLEAVIRTLAKMPRYEAAAILSNFGVSAQQIANILNDPDGFIAAMEQARATAIALGTDMKKATAEGRAWSNEWSRFGNIVGDIWTAVFNKVEPASEGLIKAIDDNMLEFGKWSHELDDVPAIVATAAIAVQGTLTTVMGAVGLLTGGISGFFSGIGSSFGVTFGIVSKLLGLLTRFASNPLIAGLAVLLYPNSTQSGFGGGTHETEAGKQHAEQGEAAAPHSTWSTRGAWNTLRRWMGMKSSSPTIGQTDAPAGRDFASAENKYGLPAGLLARIAGVESSGDAGAVSPKGALGLMQLMPKTAASYGVDPLNAPQAIDAAAQEFHKLLMKFGDLSKAEAAYNWGSGNLDKDIARWGADWARHLPAETSDYLGKLDGSRAITQNNTSNITVQGNTSPTETARLVHDGQNSVNAAAARNLGAAVQ